MQKLSLEGCTGVGAPRVPGGVQWGALYTAPRGEVLERVELPQQADHSTGSKTVADG